MTSPHPPLPPGTVKDAVFMNRVAVLGSTLFDMLAGIVAGGLVVGVVTVAGKVKGGAQACHRPRFTQGYHRP